VALEAFASPAAQALESPSRHARLVAAEGRRQRAAEQGAGGHKNLTWRDATFSATRVRVALRLSNLLVRASRG